MRNAWRQCKLKTLRALINFTLLRTLSYITLSTFLYNVPCKGQDISLKKGTTNWIVSFPYVNSFYLQTIDKYKTSTGFLGFSTGLEYFYKDSNYISINLGVALDFFFPVPAP